jgi:hypothetical protein
MAEHPYKIGTKYFIRTVTHHLCGELISVYEKELVFKDASWIADDGRFHNALRDGDFEEIEPFVNDVILNRGSIIDCTEWTHELPRKQK